MNNKINQLLVKLLNIYLGIHLTASTWMTFFKIINTIKFI